MLVDDKFKIALNIIEIVLQLTLLVWIERTMQVQYVQQEVNKRVFEYFYHFIFHMLKNKK